LDVLKNSLHGCAAAFRKMMFVPSLSQVCPKLSCNFADPKASKCRKIKRLQVDGKLQLHAIHTQLCASLTHQKSTVRVQGAFYA
jgi:hypothetical protein